MSEALIIITAIISGFSIWINSVGVKGFNPFAFTAIKNLIVALFFTLLVLKDYKKIIGLKKKDWARLVLIGIVGGSIPFLLFFYGLKTGSAASAGFIHKTMFLYVALLSGEKPSKRMIMLLVGVFLLFTPSLASVGAGDLFVLLATLLWSVEIIISKKILKGVGADIVAWARMSFGSLILLSYLFVNNLFVEVFSWTPVHWSWILFTASLLSGYVYTFYNGLRHASPVRATSILLLGSVITSIFSIFSGTVLGMTEILGLLIIIFMLFFDKNHSNVFKIPAQ